MREGDKCPNCEKGRFYIYYTLICPVCEGAKRQQRTVINLIEAMVRVCQLYDFQVHGPEYNSFWGRLVEIGYIRANDTLFMYDMTEELDPLDEIYWPERLDREAGIKFQKAMIESLDLLPNEGIIWHISW